MYCILSCVWWYKSSKFFPLTGLTPLCFLVIQHRCPCQIHPWKRLQRRGDVGMSMASQYQKRPGIESFYRTSKTTMWWFGHHDRGPDTDRRQRWNNHDLFSKHTSDQTFTGLRHDVVVHGILPHVVTNIVSGYIDVFKKTYRCHLLSRASRQPLSRRPFLP
jgi:hypothetical protein